MCSAPLAPGDAVKVIKGPLAGLEGELVILNGKSKVAVRLDKLAITIYRLRPAGGRNEGSLLFTNEIQICLLNLATMQVKC